MSIPLAHPALWRALGLFAGTLLGKFFKDKAPANFIDHQRLVCWSPGARSRREDELARINHLRAN